MNEKPSDAGTRRGSEADRPRSSGPTASRSLRPRGPTLLVLVLGLVITAALALLAASVNNRNDNRLLNLQVRQAATALSGYLPTIATPLISGASVATATGGDVGQFEATMKDDVGPGLPFSYVALCRSAAGGGDVLATLGQPAPTSGGGTAYPCRFLTPARPASSFAISGFVGENRFASSYASTDTDPRFGLYAESQLSPDRRVVISQSLGFSDLNFALYLGRTQRTGALVESTVPVPIVGVRATATVPFANTTLTLVGTPTQPLGGALSRDLSLIVSLLGVALSIGAALMTERLVRRRRSAERLAADNRQLYGQQKTLATSLQRALLPDDIPDIDAVELDTRYMAGAQGMDIGGDWFDVIGRGPDEFLFVVGDVSGRGDRAAIVMASLQYAIRAYATEGDPPDAILSKLCRLLDIGRAGHFATVLVGSVDLTTRRVTVASAGHFPPLLVGGKENGEFVTLAVGMPIGVRPEASYPTTTVGLPDGTTLLAFTDGLVERRGELIDVGLDRLREAAGHIDGPVDVLLTDITDELMPHGATDDAALLGFRWRH